MSELDEKRLDKMSRRGGLPSVDELVAMWRLTGGISFSLANERSVVTEARRRIRQAGQRLGKTQIRTLHHKESGRMFGLLPFGGADRGTGRRRWQRRDRKTFKREWVDAVMKVYAAHVSLGSIELEQLSAAIQRGS